MSQTQTTTKYDTLTEDQQQALIDEHRDYNLHDQWYEYWMDDVKEIGKILGFNFEDIFFRLHVQGAGVGLVGRWYYEEGSCDKIREHAPKDNVLHAIADEFRLIQLKCVMLGCEDVYVDLLARCDYYTSHNVEYCFPEGNDFDDPYPNLENDLIDAMKDFERWAFKAINTEYDYLTSDEAIIERLRDDDDMCEVDDD